MLYLSVYMDNVIWIENEISEENSTKFIKELMALGNNENVKEITIYINSCGGDVDQGLAIVDLIEYLKKVKKIKFTTVGINVASIASLILVSGNKRYVYPNTRMMIHKPYLEDSDEETSAEMKKVLKKEIDISIKRYKEVLLNNGNIEEQELDKLLKTDYYMSAEQCQDYGWCDYISVKI